MSSSLICCCFFFCITLLGTFFGQGITPTNQRGGKINNLKYGVRYRTATQPCPLPVTFSHTNPTKSSLSVDYVPEYICIHVVYYTTLLSNTITSIRTQLNGFKYWSLTLRILFIKNSYLT